MLSNIYLHTSNPFNIRYNKRNQWKGQVGNYRGFCIFSNDKFAIRAFLILCHVYRVKYKIKTIAQFITRYAPPRENNTQSYIRAVSDYVHGSDVVSVDGSDYILYHSPIYMYSFVQIIARYETGKEISFADFISIYKTINI